MQYAQNSQGVLHWGIKLLAIGVAQPTNTTTTLPCQNQFGKCVLLTPAFDELCINLVDAQHSTHAPIQPDNLWLPSPLFCRQKLTSAWLALRVAWQTLWTFIFCLWSPSTACTR